MARHNIDIAIRARDEASATITRMNANLASLGGVSFGAIEGTMAVLTFRLAALRRATEAATGATYLLRGEWDRAAKSMEDLPLVKPWFALWEAMSFGALKAPETIRAEKKALQDRIDNFKNATEKVRAEAQKFREEAADIGASAAEVRQAKARREMTAFLAEVGKSKAAPDEKEAAIVALRERQHRAELMAQYEDSEKLSEKMDREAREQQAVVARSAEAAARAEQEKWDAIHAAQDRAYDATHDARERELHNIDLYYIEQQLKWRGHADVMAALQDSYFQSRQATLKKFADEDAEIQTRVAERERWAAERARSEAESQARAEFGGAWRAPPTLVSGYLTGVGAEQQTISEARRAGNVLERIEELLKKADRRDSASTTAGAALTVKIEDG